MRRSASQGKQLPVRAARAEAGEVLDPAPRPDFTWEELDALRTNYRLPTEEDAGGFTVRDYAERYGIPYMTASSQLERMARDGRLLTGRTRRADRHGVLRTVNVYRLPAGEGNGPERHGDTEVQP
jgi:hypothetical protein